VIIFLYPVIAKVPPPVKALKGKKRVEALSLFARESAMASGRKSKLFMDIFDKDALGVPLPFKSVYWSISHKPGFVAGVVSIKKIGIDLEKIKDVSDLLFKKIVSPKERAHFNTQEKSLVFFRVFTAKEAVLKKTTHGIKGLSKATIKKVVDDKNLVVQYLGKKYWVENFYFDGYLASVTKDKTVDVFWTIR
jgi:4'-phosphopantetheinyl transferase